MKRIKMIPYDECHDWHRYRDVKSGEEFGCDSTSLGKLVDIINELSRKVEPVVSLQDGVNRAENWDELLDEIDMMFTQDTFLDCWVAVDVLFLDFDGSEKLWRVTDQVKSTLNVTDEEFLVFKTGNKWVIQFNLLNYKDMDVIDEE